jgi:hypothetical protein
MEAHVMMKLAGFHAHARPATLVSSAKLTSTNALPVLAKQVDLAPMA